MGMVTDATWYDYDLDGLLDLIVVGEWMPITVFKNRKVGFQKMTKVTGLTESHGLWNTLEVADINQDGIDDLIVGNLGLNSRFKASPEKPFYLFVNDFDQNGALDHIYAHYIEDDKLVPFTTKHELTMQLPELKKKYLLFKDYAGQTMEVLFGKERLNNSIVLKAETMASKVLLNLGGMFLMNDLPPRSQYSSIHAFLWEDLDDNGIKELVVAGNFSYIKPELGRYDANFGLLYESSEDQLSLVPNSISGLKLKGDIKKAATIRTTQNDKLLVFARNDDTLLFYKMAKD
ncbi:MAG: VCBS repeat-containing protein, partial [Bacteroidota bacterium]